MMYIHDFIKFVGVAEKYLKKLFLDVDFQAPHPSFHQTAITPDSKER